MIIGYSFSDDHVNQAIVNDCSTSGLVVFIIDPSGVDILDKHRDSETLIKPPMNEHLDSIRRSLAGASRRSMREIFGADGVESGKIARFFDSI